MSIVLINLEKTLSKVYQFVSFNQIIYPIFHEILMVMNVEKTLLHILNFFGIKKVINIFLLFLNAVFNFECFTFRHFLL